MATFEVLSDDGEVLDTFLAASCRIDGGWLTQYNEHNEMLRSDRLSDDAAAVVMKPPNGMQPPGPVNSKRETPQPGFRPGFSAG